MMMMMTMVMMMTMTTTVGKREASADSRLKLSALLTGEIAALCDFIIIIMAKKCTLWSTYSWTTICTAEGAYLRIHKGVVENGRNEFALKSSEQNCESKIISWHILTFLLLKIVIILMRLKIKWEFKLAARCSIFWTHFQTGFCTFGSKQGRS